MLKFLSALLGLVDKIAAYFKDQQLIDAGRAEETVQEMAKVQENVQKAKDATSVPDAVRDERLRNKYDRSRRK